MVAPPQSARLIHSSSESNDPGHTPKPVALESVRAMATVPTQFSLGEWRPIGPWIYAGKAYDVAVSPVDAGTVYAAFGSGGGLWKTSNSGQTWLQLTDRSDVTAIGCVSVHPEIPDVVVACIGGPGNPSARRGLMYSADAGRHFDFIGPSDAVSTSFYRAIFDPHDPNIVYTASEAGVYLTTDRGATWKMILTFPGNNPDYFDHLPDLAMKPDDPSVLIAAQINLGVFRTADGGTTWTRVDQNMDPATQTSVLAWSLSDPNTVYCERNYTGGQHMATYVSTDAGVTWTEAADLTFYHQDRYDMALAVDPTNSSRVVLANGFLGISTDGLKSYGGYNGYPHVDHLRVAFAPSNPAIVYDANDGGIWRSADSGATWSRLDVGVNTNISFGFDINTTSGQIYLSPADYGSFQYTSAGGWHNSTYGGEWAKFYISPNDPSTVWYAASGDLAVSHDAGTTWTDVNPDPSDGGPYAAVLRFDPAQPKTLFFLRYAKAWVSHDGGATWADTGIRPNPSDPVLGDMIFDLTQPGTAYISERGGIFASADGGTTWTENKSSVYGLPYYNGLMAPVPGVAGEFYMAAEGGLYLVSNGGQKAVSLSNAPFNTISINQIVADPANPSRVYVGTAAGLFLSQDYGQSWDRLGRNLTTSTVWQISVKGKSIYAGTSQGIWEFNADTSWQQPPPADFAIPGETASTFSLAWTPASNSAGVRVFRNGQQVYVGLDNNYTDLGLAPGTQYCYTALDSNASGEGPLSAPVCATTLVGLAGPSIALSPTSVQLSVIANGQPSGGVPVVITNGSAGTLSWAASTNVPWLSLTPATGTAPSTLAVAPNASAPVMGVGAYTGTISITGTGTTGQSIPVTLNVLPTPPSIAAVANAASFQPGIAPAAWITIFGTNLSMTTRPWGSQDFTNGALPTQLDNVSVTVGGYPAAISYVSPTQLNVQVPTAAAQGQTVPMVVTAPQGSASAMLTVQPVAPGLFTLNGKYVAALHADYSLVGPRGLYPGSSPASPGEVILVYGTGFGPTSPAVPAGQLVSQPAAMITPPSLRIGGQPAPESYAGIVGAGLYQFNVTVPYCLPAGDAPVAATDTGETTQDAVYVTVQPTSAEGTVGALPEDFLSGKFGYEAYTDTRVQPVTSPATPVQEMTSIGVVPNIGPTFAAPGGYPYVQLNSSQDVVTVHPCAGDCSNPQGAVMAFCVSGTRAYRVQGAFARANVNVAAGVGVQGIVFRNYDLANPLFLTAISSNNQVDPTNYFGGTGAAAFDVRAEMNSGDCLRVGVFAMPNAGDGTFDATAVQLQIANP